MLQAVYNLDNIILYFCCTFGKCTTNRTYQNRTDHSREGEPGKKKAKVLPSDNNSPNRTDNQEGQSHMKKKEKVFPSDNNSPK